MQRLTAENELALTDLGAQGDVLLGGTSDLLGGHFGGLTVTLGLGGVVCCKVSISSFPVVKFGGDLGAMQNALGKAVELGRLVGTACLC